jgi:mono/diheme cytochrome c family protein
VLLTAALGCSKKAAAPPAAAAATATSGGQQIFDQNCAKCHSTSESAAQAEPPPGEGGKMGGRRRGPNLSHVGADQAHTPDWIATHIRDPKAHKPDSRMPSFESKLQPAEIQSIADYLAGLK